MMHLTTQQLEKIRQDFVANVSHELRTPLTVIHGYLEILRDQKAQAPEAWSPMFDQMYQQSVHMEKIIEDLLLLASLESHAPDHETTELLDVSAMITSIIQEAEAFSGEKQHVFNSDCDEQLMIEGVERECRSAFSNIIFNAVKYTPEKGNILIRWFKQDNMAVLEVHDSGIGIDAKHIPRLTERFYRVDKARSRASGGTGLGLAIVKHVLIRHHASLEIQSEPQKGSCFSCLFPL